jgi:hypothetical protein
VHFINDINFISTLGRLISNVFNNLPHFIDATISGPVNLKNIDRISVTDFEATRTLITRIWGRSLLAIKSPGKDPGRSSFPHAPDTGKKVAVGDPV